MTPHQPERAAGRVMWAAIAGSTAVLGALLAIGWDDGAWAAAAGVLLVSCVFVCIWAVTQGRVTDREVGRAVARLSTARDEQSRRRTPERETIGGR